MVAYSIRPSGAKWLEHCNLGTKYGHSWPIRPHGICFVVWWAAELRRVNNEKPRDWTVVRQSSLSQRFCVNVLDNDGREVQFTHTRTHRHTHKHTRTHTPPHTHTQTHRHTPTPTHTHRHTHTHTDTHTHPHTHTHTHTHTSISVRAHRCESTYTHTERKNTEGELLKSSVFCHSDIFGD